MGTHMRQPPTTARHEKKSICFSYHLHKASDPLGPILPPVYIRKGHLRQQGKAKCAFTLNRANLQQITEFHNPSPLKNSKKITITLINRLIIEPHAKSQRRYVVDFYLLLSGESVEDASGSKNRFQ